MRSVFISLAGRLTSIRPALSILIPALVLGCSSTPGVVQENQPPTVDLTSGPVEGETVSYSVDIGWEGSDPDGVVQRFEYAVDPPAVFTEEEIAGGGPGVVSEVVPGTGEDPDATRITKIVDGDPITFDWVHTTDTSHHFVFQTAEAESVSNGGIQAPSGRFTGMHAVYVRAVDNDEAVSGPDHVAFTAETVAPEATITRPNIAANVLTTGDHVVLDWNGTDPDGPAPVGYLYKLINLSELTPPISLVGLSSPSVLYTKGDEWTYRSADEPPLELDLQTPAAYIFGVRAVDEAGAEEPFLNFGRNAFKFQAFSGSGYPALTFICPSGTFTFRNTDGRQTELPADFTFSVDVSCSAEEYGETCVDFRWGLDILNLDDDNAWTPWSTDFTIDPLRLSPGVHTLNAQVHDSLGNLTTGRLYITATAMPLDQEALWVDDSFDDIYPRDSEHDAFWRARFAAYGLSADEHAVWGDNDRGTTNPQALRLSELGHYKLLIWDTRGTGFNGNTGLVQSIIDRSLQLYLAAGGKLWLDGRLDIGATVPDVTGQRGDLNYPKELVPGDFAWDFLKLHTTRINDDKGAITRNNLLVVHPFPGRPETYPEMTVDSAKQPAALAGLGMAFADAVFDPIFANAEPGFEGALDSLYTYGATGNEVQGKASTYHNRLVAVRWHDPDPARSQGRIQWFGFPLYFFNDAEAQETFNRSLDWFQEESPPAAP